MIAKFIPAHGSDAVAHHAANVAAIFIPVGAWFAHVQPILAGLLTLIGLGWYGVLFYDRFIAKHK